MSPHPERYHTLTPRTLRVTSQGEKGLPEGIRVLKQGGRPGRARWAPCKHRLEEREAPRGPRRRWTMEAAGTERFLKTRHAGVEEGGRRHEPRNPRGPDTEKGQGKGLPGA